MHPCHCFHECCLKNEEHFKHKEDLCIFNIAQVLKIFALLTFLFLTFSLLLFISFSQECFGCYAGAHKAWKSETVPLKRQILDVPPKAPPSLYLLSTFPLSSHLFSSFCVSPNFFSSSVQTEIRWEAVLLLQAVCPRQTFQVSFLSPLPIPYHLSPLLPSLSSTLVSLRSPSSRTPTLPLALLQSLPSYICLSGKVSDMSSGCRQRLQQPPLLLLHAVKLTPSNQLGS